MKRPVKSSRAIGVVFVIFLVGSGVSFADASEPTPEPTPPPSANDQRQPASTSDFDGDGFADLAVAAEDWTGEPVGVEDFPGTVTIIYGSRNSLTRLRRQTFKNADFSKEPPTDTFGTALATADFDADGFADLAIALSSGAEPDDAEAGQVRVLYGSAMGLTSARNQLWTQDTPGIAGASETGDNFGSALVAGDFGRGAEDDLVIGVNGENDDSGAVNVIYGSSSGLAASGNQYLSQTTSGVPGKRQSTGTREMFGSSLAAGDLDGNGHPDLAVGVPGDGIAGLEDVGSVNIFYGSTLRLAVEGSQLWSQRTRGIRGKPASNENFATSLAVGHFDEGTDADIAIAVPFDREALGAVHVLYGSYEGITSKGAQFWSRRSRGLHERDKLGLLFGQALAVGNFGHGHGGSSFSDLAIRGDLRMKEDEGSQAVVEVIYGSPAGLVTAHSQAWTLDSPGVKGRLDEAGSDTGSTLAAADFGKNIGGAKHSDLVLGDSLIGTLNVLYGSSGGVTARGDQLWTPADVSKRDFQWFGKALAAH